MDDEAAIHAEIERKLHGLDGVVAAIRVAGKIGLAHAGDEMPGAAAVGERASEGEEGRLRPGTKVVGSPLAPISIATSRVSAVSDTSPSA